MKEPDVEELTDEALKLLRVLRLAVVAQLAKLLAEEARSCKRFLQTLEEVKAEIVGQTFDGERNKLGKCLQGLDQKILDSRQYVKEYQRIRPNLHTLNESLAQLAAEPLSRTDMGEIIRGRVKYLRSQKKI